MKRHPALEPFSRDHNGGLVLARMLQLRRPGADQIVREAWDVELKDHFEEEERLLGELCGTEQFGIMVADHRAIASLIESLPESSESLGRALHDHIRWEERELFPWIESHSSPEQLEALAEQAEPMEKRRWEHDLRRKELVSRRWQ